MQTFTVVITNADALKVLQELQEKKFINILSNPDLNAPVFPGKPLTTEEFRNIIKVAEHSGSVSLNEAKASWASQRKELLKLAK